MNRSKYDHKLISVSNTSTQVRMNSLLSLQKNFQDALENNRLLEEGYSYDTRVYVDSNSEEYYPYMFSKTLFHDLITGFPRKNDVDKVIQAQKSGRVEDLDMIPIYSMENPKLEGVCCGQSFNLVGTDPSVYCIREPHTIDSVDQAFEMCEVYAMSRSRDIPFTEFKSNETIKIIIESLNKFPTKTTHPLQDGNINEQNLFRGFTSYDTIGPYISQFLMYPFDYGNLPIVQKYYSENDDLESTDISVWYKLQQGKYRPKSLQNKTKFTYTPRVLGAKVHNDPLFQFYYNAALICLQNNIIPEIYNHNKTTAWTSGGPPNILASVAHVCQGALRVAWYSKYSQTMKIRPEVLAQRINLAENPPTGFDISRVPGLSKIKTNMKIGQGILDLISDSTFNKYQNFLLLNQFMEGSPTHPSSPAGHAVVAGAGVTILKAMFLCHDKSNKPIPWGESNRKVYVSMNGDTQDEYNGDDIHNMTIVGELNKLASNITLGRNFAGVHYRCDGDCGLKLGESYAISYLLDMTKELHESQSGLFEGWTLEKFDGSIVKIASTGVTEVQV